MLKNTDRQQSAGIYFDYAITYDNSMTSFFNSEGIFRAEIAIQKALKKPFIAYTWNEDHGVYVQCDCYPTIPFPNLP